MSKKGHVPIRTCIGCRKKRKKEEMIWLTQSPEGVVKSEREEISSRARVLSLSRSWVFEHGKEKEQKGWVLGDDGFPGSFGKGFFKE